MPQTIDVPGFGGVDFPDTFTPEQIGSVLTNDPLLAPFRVAGVGPRGSQARSERLAREQQLIRRQTLAESPDYYDPWEASQIFATEAARGGLQAIPTAITGAATMAEWPIEMITGAELPLREQAQRLETWAASLVRSEERTSEYPITAALGQGLGNIAAQYAVPRALGVGLRPIAGLGAARAVAHGAILVQNATAEFGDTINQELQRQAAAGEDQSKLMAFAKAIGYTIPAVAIEYTTGVPRLVRRAFEPAQRLGWKPALSKVIPEAALGFFQEYSQAQLQNLVVHGRFNGEDAFLEGIGGLWQGPLAAHVNLVSQRNARAAGDQLTNLRQQSRPLEKENDDLIGVLMTREGDATDQEKVRYLSNLDKIRSFGRNYADLARSVGASGDPEYIGQVLEHLRTQGQLTDEEAERIGDLVVEGYTFAEPNRLPQLPVCPLVATPHMP